jgi:hypothetical protein
VKRKAVSAFLSYCAVKQLRVASIWKWEPDVRRSAPNSIERVALL